MKQKTFLRKAIDSVVSSLGYSTYSKEQIEHNQAIALNTTNLSEQDIQKRGLRKSGVSFDVLNLLSKQDAIIRICINVIKNAVSQSSWKIEIDKDFKDDKQVQKAQQRAIDLFEYTNVNEENLRVLTSRLVEDILKYDAGVIEKIKTLDGKDTLGLNVIDGKTIAPVLNQYGEFGDPGYKQLIQSKVVAEFQQSDIVYIMMNPQNDINTYGYGLSNIESILLQVQASMEADMYNIKSFTQSNMPPGMLDLGDMDEMEAKKFMSVWRSTVQTNPHAMKFVYGGSSTKRFIPFNSSNKDMQYAEYTDWLTRIKLAAFGLSGLEANITQDMNRSTSETQYKISQSRGVGSMKQLLEEYFTRSIVWKIEEGNEAYKKIKFKYIQAESLTEKKTQADIDKIYTDTGILDINEIREREGYEPKKEIPYTEELDKAMREDMQEEEMFEGEGDDMTKYKH